MADPAFTEAEIKAYLKKHGCFCGGDGKYTDYNCGAELEMTCPHCRGTGKKKCACPQPTLECRVGAPQFRGRGAQRR